jgi:hypothetical protein
MPRWMRFGCMLLLSPFVLPAAPGRASPGGTAPPDTLAPPPPAVRAWQTGTRPDRFQHAGLAFTLGLGAGLATRRPAVAAAGACGLGLLKEVRDTRHGGFDAVDLAADALGAALSALATHAASR